jgi:hypothetical protein
MEAMTLFELNHAATGLAQKLAVIGLDGMVVGAVLFMAGATLAISAYVFR